MKRNLKHSKKVLIWTFTWLISFAILVIGPKELWENTTITIIAALLNFILIIAMLFANKNQFDGFPRPMAKRQPRIARPCGAF